MLVKRFLTEPVTHSVDSAQSPVADDDAPRAARRARAAAPRARRPDRAAGRTVVFTRTKHGAKKLARQLNAERRPVRRAARQPRARTPATRNLEAFPDGKATTLVATDIAARGIHVDDVALVIHADPPVEHKAYLHRSGRTARAGAEGTVVTLMTDDQVRDVRDLTRAAGISRHHDPGARHRPPGADPARPRRAGAGARWALSEGAGQASARQSSGERPAGQGRPRRRRSGGGGSSAGAQSGQQGQAGKQGGKQATRQQGTSQKAGAKQGSGGNGGGGNRTRSRRGPAAASGRPGAAQRGLVQLRPPLTCASRAVPLVVRRGAPPSRISRPSPGAQ